jgi:hypothetical protein
MALLSSVKYLSGDISKNTIMWYYITVLRFWNSVAKNGSFTIEREREL